jgi:hypothetical protein
MISIIVSSYNPNFYTAFSKNVEETIGVPYEIIQVKNPGIMSICAAYNRGIEQAQYNILCFAHEDILFKTGNWGKKVIDLFQQNQIGLLGIAGSTYKLRTPSGWGFVHSAQRGRLIQHHKFSQKDWFEKDENPDNEILSKVVCVDGVWMCTTKSVVKECRFDEELFTSFHCYDIDFSLAVFQKFNVFVTLKF